MNIPLGSSRCIQQRVCCRSLHRKGLLVYSSVQGIISQDIWPRLRTRSSGHAARPARENTQADTRSLMRMPSHWRLTSMKRPSMQGRGHNYLIRVCWSYSARKEIVPPGVGPAALAATAQAQAVQVPYDSPVVECIEMIRLPFTSNRRETW
jgi:hypothetical protein